MVSIGYGDLARAVRASMAEPGVFSPVRWGDRILVDGGIRDYLPVDEARRLGATFVIAVDALHTSRKIPSTNAVTVADRGIRLLLERARAGSSAPDILVLPDLDPALTPFEYPSDTTPLLKAGLRATLREVGPADTPPSSNAEGHVLHDSPESLGPVTVEAPGSPIVPFVRRAFEGMASAPYDSTRVLRMVDRLYVTGLVTGVWPSVEDSTWGWAASTDSTAAGSAAADPRRAGAPLVIRAETHGTITASGAVGYDTDRGGRAWGSLHRLDGRGGVPLSLGIDGLVDGIDHWGDLSLRIPALGRFPTAWTAGGFLGESEIRFLALGSGEEESDVKRGGGWLGAEWRMLDPDLEGSVLLRAERIDSDIGPSGSSYGAYARVGAVTPNDESIGTAPMLEGEARTGDVHYAHARIKGSFIRSRGDLKVAFLADAEGVTSKAPLDAAPALGNDFRIPGLQWGEHRGRACGVGGIDLSYRARFKASLGLRLRGGAITDAMEPDGSLSGPTTWMGGGGLSALWWTAFGRIETGLEASTRGDRRALVRLGSEF